MISAMLSPAPDQWTVREAAHLLNRAGFGGTPAQIKTFHAFGRRKAVESLLKPAEAMDKFPAPEWATAENDPVNCARNSWNCVATAGT